jgi:hypothetical protein
MLHDAASWWKVLAGEARSHALLTDMLANPMCRFWEVRTSAKRNGSHLARMVLAAEPDES